MLFNVGSFSSDYVIFQGMGESTADVLWSEMRFYWDEPLLSSQSWERTQVSGKVKASLFSTDSQTPMNSQFKLLLHRLGLGLQPHLRLELHSAGHHTASCKDDSCTMKSC